MERRIAPSARIEEAIEAVLLDGLDEPDALGRIGRLGAELVIQRAIEDEVEAFLGRARYERAPEARGSRNGQRPRRIQAAEGELTVAVPQVRDTLTRFVSTTIPDTKAIVRTRPLEALVIGAYVRGLSDRDIESLAREAGLGSISGHRPPQPSNGIDTERPDMWVCDSDGELLAALKVDESNAFINDVAIGPDGAAYFTISNAPQIFRVQLTELGWTVETWLDASADISQQDGFNLGGIVVSPDGSTLVVAQGNAGVLWRVDLGSGTVQRVDTDDADLTGADGLVLDDGQLTVVRNFPRSLATLEFQADGSAASLLDDVVTVPERVLTTAKIAGSDLLLIDSKFDEETAEPPFDVVAIDLGSLVD